MYRKKIKGIIGEKYRKVKYLFIFIIPFIFSLPANASNDFLSDYMQTVYNEESAIPVTAANYVLQTKDNFLWVASYDGLFRYDGKESVLFNKENYGFPTQNVNILFEDSRGVLWIGTNDAGIVCYKEGKFVVYGVEEGLASNSVRAIAEDQDNNIYVATTSGVSRISSEGLIDLPFKETENMLVMDIICTKNNEIWCVQSDDGIRVFKDGVNIHSYPAGFFEDIKDVNCIYQTKDEKIYIGTLQNKVVCLENPEQRDKYTIIDMGSGFSVQRFYEDNEDRLFICATEGLKYLKGGLLYNVGGSLIDVSLSNMIQDFEGNYWVTSSRRGIIQFSKSKFTNISFQTGLPELTVNSTKLYRSKLYIGADQGLFIVNARGVLEENELTEMLKDIRIRCIISDNENNLWICCYQEYGLLKYNEGKNSITYMTPENSGLVSIQTRCALACADGRIVVGTNSGISIIKDDKVIENYNVENGISSTYILSLAEDEEGNIYLGSDGDGIYKIENGQITNYNEEDGLESGIILRMIYDKDYDGFWISTGNSFCFWDKQQFKPIPLESGLRENIFDIQLIEENQLLALSSKGVFLAFKEELLAEGGINYLLQKQDGLLSAVTANSWSDMSENQGLYLPCSTGVFFLDVDNHYRNMSVPRVVVTEINVDGVSYDLSSDIVIPGNAQRITFKFAILTYNNIQGAEVSYLLEGFDTEPVVLRADNPLQVSYTNLKGGKYIFYLSGINSDGVESEEEIYTVTKELTWIEQTVNQVILIVIGMAVIVFIIIFVVNKRTAAILKRQKQYRMITDQAIKAIADTIDAKDKYTAGHSRRVAKYSLAIGKKMGLSQRDQEDLYYTALLHDIGKVGLPDNILVKSGPLTNEEYDQMKTHVSIGGDILESISVIDNIAIGARYHHERFDGKGYMSGISGKEIPLFARIIAVADAYDAMSSDRPYRGSLEKEKILEELINGKDAQFDGDILACMLDLLSSGQLEETEE